MIVSGVLLLNTASTAIETAAPSVSLWLNPLNSEARLGAAIAKLQEEAQSVDPATRQLIKTGIALSPIDARFYSLMGIAEEQQGNLDEASRYYDRALTIAPAEIQALIHKLRFAINAGDYVEAVDYMEIIGRRWGYWPSMQAVLSFLMSDDRAFAEIADRFSNQAVLRALVFQNLDRSDDGLTRAQSLLLDWHSRGVPDLNDFINKTTSDLVRNKRYADAFELFRSTRKPQNEMPNDRIYNGSFELPPSGNGFDWQIRGQAGVDFTFLALEGANQSATTTQAGLQRPSKGTGLSIRFLNNPIQLRNVSQMILLEPGAYRLAVTFSTRDLRAFGCRFSGPTRRPSMSNWDGRSCSPWRK